MHLSHPNALLIQRFHDSSARRYAQGMLACYADGVKFSDPVFVDLDAAKARAGLHAYRQSSKAA